MEASFGESTPSHGPSCSSSSPNDAGDFECNICFELAQDPIVTLCGHLFCWPCLYRWLNMHSHSHECPVCKALVLEDKLVPLYGRGKAPSDPRSRAVPGIDIPGRPAGQRPETAHPHGLNRFPQQGSGFRLLGGFMPMATARASNATLALIPPLFNLQVHGFNDAAAYGSAPGFPHGVSDTYPHDHLRQQHQHHHHHQQQQSDSSRVKMCLLLLGVLTIFYLIIVG